MNSVAPGTYSRNIERDHRIDAFRGISLLLIYVSHLAYLCDNNVLRNWSVTSLALFDCANVFVFVSGYVAGMVYGRILDRNGFLVLCRRTFKRAWQLYYWHLGTLFLTVVLMLLIKSGGVDLVEQTRLEPLLAQPFEGILASLTMLYTPYAFDVLRLYVIFLIILPFWLVLLRRRPIVALVLAVAVYAVPQFVHGTGITDWPGGRDWYFNPLAWQILFFGGAAIARLGLPGPTSFWRSRWLMWFAALVIVGGVFVRKIAPPLMAMYDPAIPFIHDDLVYGKLPMVGKTTLGLVRLFSFAAMALLATRFVPREPTFWQRAGLRHLASCGRHGLMIYCLGLMMAFVGGHVSLVAGGGNLIVVTLSVAGMAAQMLAAYSLERDAVTRRMSVRTP